MDKRGVAVLGSTGSIGRQALDIVAAHPERFSVAALTAHSRAERLVEQARRFRPNAVVIGKEDLFPQVRDALADLPVKVFAGAEAMQWVTGLSEVDVVLNAVVGAAGMPLTWAAVAEGKPVALANKESLVVAGGLIMAAAREKGVPILPVDSEHSAIFQCLIGEPREALHKIVLTASGGPFRGWKAERLHTVTPAQALRHPNWDMGAKITIDSATLMNKGLEVIEAHWLFDLPPEQIEVVVHPQSIIHSMVVWRDGSVKAQLGWPDMKVPIAYALAFPQRLPLEFPPYEWPEVSPLTFEAPDRAAFPALDLCYAALKEGGNRPCALNAANEVAVHLFLQQKIRFTDIPRLIERGMASVPFIEQPTLAQLLETDQAVRQALNHSV